MPDEGFRKWLGVEYEVMEDGRAVLGMPVRDEMRNPRGVVQGGAVAALLDVGMSTAASGGNYQTRKRALVTLEMKINYLAPATGDRLTCTSEVVNAGSRTVVVRSEIVTDQGKVCAVGLGTFMTRRVHATDPEGVTPPKG